jgi:hypothetical protein
MPQSSPEAARRTRSFARVLGPFIAIATLIVAIRLPNLTGVANDMFANEALPWILGAIMVMAGLIIIAFHQYWYSLTAVLISLFGWFVGLRGVAMMALPSTMRTAVDESITSPGLLLAGRVFMLLLTMMGLWLTYVGWISRPASAPVDNFSAAAP